MSGITKVNDFAEEITFLDSMFGGTVSTAVITTVLESCNGNVLAGKMRTCACTCTWTCFLGHMPKCTKPLCHRQLNPNNKFLKHCFRLSRLFTIDSYQVHLAADAIMNFSDELSTPSQGTTENIDVRPVQVTSQLNVEAQPFEYSPQQTTGHQPFVTGNQTQVTLQLPSEKQEVPTNIVTQPAPRSVNQQSPSKRQKPPKIVNQHPSTTGQSPIAVNQQPATSTWQQPSTSSWQPPSTLNHQPPYTAGPLSTAEAPSVSFSEAYRNSGALPKKPPDTNPQKPGYTMKNIWNDPVGKIVHHHNQGTRILIIMRGVSGSGKTHLAKHIVDNTVGASSQNYSRHIFSTDNYFMRRGVYQYNRDSLSEAHAMNQRNVCEATNNGVSPVIIDNTNTELWEMEPYIRDGVRNGYMIEFVEPRTPWARNLNQLERRNIHGVSRDGIRRMLDRYDRGITPESVMKSLRLTYPPNRKPPVLSTPPFSIPGPPRESPKRGNRIKFEDNKDQTSNNSRVETANCESSESSVERQNIAMNHVSETENSPDNFGGVPIDEHDIKLKKIIEAQQKLEQFEKVEQEWENGESWDVTNEANKKSSQSSNRGFGAETINPKPPRETENKDLMKAIEICNDWAKFMPSWQDSNNTNSGTTVEIPVQVESKSIGTCFEVEDMNGGLHSVLYGTPRDINEDIPERNRTTIPKAIVVDKSTSTHDNDFLSKKEVCKNKELHFRELRRMFRSVPHQYLRDIFESCNFDVNWAVNLVLDSYPESQEIFNTGVEVSDEEDEGPVEECNCLAGYNIVPDVAPRAEVASAPEPENAPQISTPVAQKKPKRDNKLSDNSMQLKRQIESNVTIPDNHYSQHYLNLRRRRENNIDGADRGTASVSNDSNSDVVAQSNISGLDTNKDATALPQTTTDFRDIAGPSTAQYNLQFLDADPVDSDTESDSNKSDNPETANLITINLGREFLAKLDDLFGRKDFLYPDNIQPVVNLPISILQQINAHWAMSVAAQMDDGSRQSEAMIEQDEDFARNLAAKEQKMSEEGKEPEVPTLKEIMDMELAYAIYERGVAEWRNNEPQDLAAKLSREKLYNLFPDLSKEVLSEMLMAHDYSFKATIESLIISTGQTNWLEDEKGVEKFVMHKETERKEKFLEEQNKNLEEAEWPYLSNPDKPITLETVNFYRAEAEKSLQNRNTNFEKARQYIARNNPSAASFYSDIAALHTRKYEQSCNLAAAYLMNFHLLNNPDHDVLDLHYLRVPEAMVSLDMFIDQVILRLRAMNTRSKAIWIITGKGIHSVGGPRVKPATKKRLKAREITFKLVNGGMLTAELHITDKMSSELPGNNP